MDFSGKAFSTQLFVDIFRGVNGTSASLLDIMVGVFRTVEGATQPKPQSYVAHSPRKIRQSVGCNVFLEAGAYLIGTSMLFVKLKLPSNIMLCDV